MRPAARASNERARGRGNHIGELYSGTSGFSYATWKGKFYPASLPGSKMLEHYALHLRGVELNGSFYRLPPATALEKWAASTPDGFRFCMKANRGLTYSAEAFDKVGLARLFADRMRTLGQRLGPVLLQFPPVRQRNVAQLESLLDAIGGTVACEFRHDSWFHDETYDAIRRHGGAVVVTDEEKWPQAPLVEVGPVAYFRLRRGYTTRALEPWTDLVRAALGSHDQVHVYFKHDPQAPRLALRLQAAIAERASGSRARRRSPSAPRPAAPVAAPGISTGQSAGS
jgi:uncharacterized protein YecE (DUF72 family)